LKKLPTDFHAQCVQLPVGIHFLIRNIGRNSGVPYNWIVIYSLLAALGVEDSNWEWGRLMRQHRHGIKRAVLKGFKTGHVAYDLDFLRKLEADMAQWIGYTAEKANADWEQFITENIDLDATQAKAETDANNTEAA
jgi:hypothetical protein